MAEFRFDSFADAALNGLNNGRRMRAEDEQRQDRLTLRDLAAGAIGGDPNAQAQAYAIDPNVGQAYSQAGDKRLLVMRNMAKIMMEAMATNDPQRIESAYQMVRPGLTQFTQGKPVPPNFTPDMRQNIEQLWATTGHLDKGSEVPSDIRSLQMLQQNPDLLKLDLERRRAGYEMQYGTQAAFREPPQPRAPSDLDSRINYARQMGATEDEIRRMVIGREGAAAGAKPMPAAALRMVTDANAALKEVETVNSTLAKIRADVASKKLELGPVRNALNRGRVALGMGNDESTRLSTMDRSLRALQNAALRLNKGVQTEGDAQRIWQELLGNLSDEESVLANIDRLIELNTRAQELHEDNLAEIRENYGRNQDAAPAPSGGPQPGMVEDGYRFKGGDPSNPASWTKVQ